MNSLRPIQSWGHAERALLENPLSMQDNPQSRATSFEVMGHSRNNEDGPCPTLRASQALKSLVHGHQPGPRSSSKAISA